MDTPYDPVACLQTVQQMQADARADGEAEGPALVPNCIPHADAAAKLPKFLLRLLEISRLP